jgi:DNA invertase Pin-like site-specific DNA recombinase
MKKFISYTRVSTSKQGLGLDAQAAIIAEYVKKNGGTIIAEYEEKESGKDTINRPELQAAIAQCKSEGAVLVVAKLDRLSRDIADIFTLKKDRGLEFEVCDVDASDTLTLGIFATLAQKERELISRRTKEALAALKAEGKKLGNPNAGDTLRKYNHLGCEARKRAALTNERNRHAYDAVRFMPGTYEQKAAYLNAHGYKTRTGKAFRPASVYLLEKQFSSVAV